MTTHTITLQDGETVQFGLLPALIAKALHDDERARLKEGIKISAKLAKMVDAGTLVLRDSLTLEPLVFENDVTFEHGVVSANDLRQLLDSMGVVLDICTTSSSKQIRLSASHQRISVEDALTLLTDAMGSPDGVMKDGLTETERLIVNIDHDFSSVCAKQSIHPRSPDHPGVEFTGATGQSVQFDITLEEFTRYCDFYDVFVEVIGAKKDDGWRQKVRAKADAICKEDGRSYSANAVSGMLEVWCRNEEIFTDQDTNPSAQYIRKQALKGWKAP